jgi:hypothetical protein
MPDTLPALEARRDDLLQRLREVGDFRSGSITAVVKRCGKANCHCARSKDTGHGPNLRLTYKKQGKTVTETLSAPGALRKAQGEIAAFRLFQGHIQALVEVNAAICRLRSVSTQDPNLTAQGKKRRKQSKARFAGK